MFVNLSRLAMRAPSFRCIASILLRLLLCSFTLFSVDSESVLWSGYTWYLRDQTSSGPGPNVWTTSQNVNIDSAGNLHMAIRNTTTGWTSAELYFPDTVRLGFGTYQWQVLSGLNVLDPNVVFGLFPYTVPSLGPDGTNEIDIEFAMWGVADNSNRLSWTVYPYVSGISPTSKSIPVSTSNPTTVRFIWNSTAVRYQFFTGFVDIHSSPSASLLSEWTFAPANASAIPQQPLPLHMNLWLFQGKNPTNNQPVNISIESFQWTNATENQATTTTTPSPVPSSTSSLRSNTFYITCKIFLVPFALLYFCFA